jgi:Protein of unknown function (DUF2934)
MANVTSKAKRKAAKPLPLATERASVATAAVASPRPPDPIIEHQEIAGLASSYWAARGFSDGAPEEDWYRAEEELKKRAVAGLVRKASQTIS